MAGERHWNDRALNRPGFLEPEPAVDTLQGSLASPEHPGGVTAVDAHAVEGSGEENRPDAAPLVAISNAERPEVFVLMLAETNDFSGILGNPDRIERIPAMRQVGEIAAGILHPRTGHVPP